MKAPMKVLTVRQPWAWLEVVGFKPIENRTWHVRYRGPLAILAAVKPERTPLDEIERRYRVRIDRDALQFGGIVGVVDLVDIVTSHPSRWFTGPFGWVLANPRRIEFVPMRGMQSLFDMPQSIAQRLA